MTVSLLRYICSYPFPTRSSPTHLCSDTLRAPVSSFPILPHLFRGIDTTPPRADPVWGPDGLTPVAAPAPASGPDLREQQPQQRVPHARFRVPLYAHLELEQAGGGLPSGAGFPFTSASIDAIAALPARRLRSCGTPTNKSGRGAMPELINLAAVGRE